MGIFLGIFLDRFGYPAVGIALPENGVYGGSQYFRIGCPNLLPFLCLRVCREVRNGETFALEFIDCVLELRDRCADVGQFDDVCIIGKRI